MTQQNQSTFSWADFHAKISRSQEEERALKEKNRDYFLSLPGFAHRLDRNGFSLKMLEGCSRLPMEETLESFSQKWPRWGMAFHGGYWTLDSSESPNGAVECSLSDVLETTDVSERYALSERAAKGILRRANARGKILPENLEKALKEVAKSQSA